MLTFVVVSVSLYISIGATILMMEIIRSQKGHAKLCLDGYIYTKKATSTLRIGLLSIGLLSDWPFVLEPCLLPRSAVLRSHVICLSVRLSVTLVDHDHIGWKSWKLISRTISPTPSLLAQRSSTYCQGNVEKFWGDYRGGLGKEDPVEC